MRVNVRKQQINFYDDLNFPEGFRRSGVFTILEAEFLTQNGMLMQALYDGRVAPESDEEVEFVEAIQNRQSSQQLSVKVWNKYLLAVENKRSQRIFMSRHCFGPMATNC